MGILTVIAIALVCVVAAGSSGRHGDSQCCGCVNMDQRSLLNNALTSAEGGYSTVGDPTIAVGNDDDGGRLMVMINNAITIFRKSTMERLDSFTTTFCFQCNFPHSDGYVTYDATINRFIMTMPEWANLQFTIQSPAAIAGGPLQRPAGTGLGPSTYSFVGAPIVVASPLDACTSIASAVGSIVLLQRGTCNFDVKIYNAQLAGAVGVVVYNSVAGGEGFINMGCGANATFCAQITIPSVFVQLSTGLSITANLPAVGSMAKLGTVGNYYTPHMRTLLNIGVSTSSTPNAVSDFYIYKVADLPYWNFSFADYPKHATNIDSLVVSAQNFVANTPNLTYEGAVVVALDKASLADGSGAFATSGVRLPTQGFLMPAETRMTLSSPHEPVYLVGFGGDITAPTTPDSIAVYRMTAGGLVDSTPVVFETPAMGSTTARQPLPAVPSGLETDIFFSTAVVRQRGSRLSLYTAIAYNVSAVHTVIRWFEMDITDTWANDEILMRQTGDYNPGMDLDVFYPHLDVDKDGNLVISGAISGPNQYVSTFYTGRLVDDPLNTLRYPPIIWAKGNSTYYWAPRGRNRWDDYSGCAVDPVDGKTMYMYGQIPDPHGEFIDGFNTEWTTPIGTMQINKRGECDGRTCTTPAINAVDSAQEAKYAKEHPVPVASAQTAAALKTAQSAAARPPQQTVTGTAAA